MGESFAWVYIYPQNLALASVSALLEGVCKAIILIRVSLVCKRCTRPSIIDRVRR
jgi:hypothetical protein